MKRPLILFGDPILRTPPPLVEEFGTGNLYRQLEQMGQTMRAVGGVGLAATQVGWFRRAFVWEAEGRHGSICNPTIIERSGALVAKTEGCLSIPNYAASVFRDDWVELHGFTPDGEPMAMVADGLIARIFQHEVDHLDGKLFIDRTAGLERAKTFEALRNGDAWQMARAL